MDDTKWKKRREDYDKAVKSGAHQPISFHVRKLPYGGPTEIHYGFIPGYDSEGDLTEDSSYCPEYDRRESYFD